MNKRSHLRWLGLASSVLLAALLLVLAAVKWRYGGGNPYPGVTTAPLLPDGVLEPLAELDYPPGNVAVSAEVFEHWFAPGEARFAQDLRVTPDGKAVVLADTGLFKFTAPGLIVLDIATRQHRIRLAQHSSLQAQDRVIRTPFGPHKLAYGLVSLVFTDSAIPTYIDALARPPSIKRLAAGRPYRLWRIPAP